MSIKRKISLCLLFALSSILIAITGYRVSAIIRANGRQQLRSLWASIEILAASAVSNALIIGSFLRDRGVKKAKFKGGSRTGSVDQPSINTTLTNQHWGTDSDQDLFRTLGGRLDSVAEGSPEPKPRAPPKAVVTDMSHLKPNGEPNGTWFSTTHSSQEDKITGDSSSDDGNISPTTERRPPAPYTQDPRFHDQTFFDVGGALESNDTSPRPSTGRPVPSPSQTTLARDFAPPSMPASRRGSSVSGLGPPSSRYDFNTPSRQHRRRDSSARGQEPKLGMTQELNDPGGLLS